MAADRACTQNRTSAAAERRSCCDAACRTSVPVASPERRAGLSLHEFGETPCSARSSAGRQAAGPQDLHHRRAGRPVGVDAVHGSRGRPVRRTPRPTCAAGSPARSAGAARRGRRRTATSAPRRRTRLMEHASGIARQMLRPVGHVPGHRAGLGAALVRPANTTTGRGRASPPVSQRCKLSVDIVTSAGIIGECYQQAVETLRGSRDRLDRLAHTLLDRETLDEDEAYAAAGISRETAPATGARAAARLVTARTLPVRKNLLPNGRGFTPRPGLTRRPGPAARWRAQRPACSASGQQGAAGCHE